MRWQSIGIQVRGAGEKSSEAPDAPARFASADIPFLPLHFYIF